MEKEKELVVMLEVDISSDSLCIYMPVFVFKLVSPNCKFLSYVSCILMRNYWLLVEQCSHGHCGAGIVFGGTGIVFG